MTTPLFLGVDGGGTRCRARLEMADGQVLGSGLSGPASMRFGFDAMRESVMAATRQALAEAGLNDETLKNIYAGIGLAGTGHLGARAALDAWKHPFAGVWFEGDGYIAWLGAFGGDEGGIVVCGGIHMTDIPSFPYSILWEERSICSVANLTRRDGEEFLTLAPKVPVRTEIETFPLEDANEALKRLRDGKVQGAAVLLTKSSKS